MISPTPSSRSALQPPWRRRQKQGRPGCCTAPSTANQASIAGSGWLYKGVWAGGKEGMGKGNSKATTSLGCWRGRQGIRVSPYPYNPTYGIDGA